MYLLSLPSGPWIPNSLVSWVNQYLSIRQQRGRGRAGTYINSLAEDHCQRGHEQAEGNLRREQAAEPDQAGERPPQRLPAF